MDETSAASAVQHRDVAERATQEEVVPLQSSIAQRVGHQQQAPQHLQQHQEHQEQFDVSSCQRVDYLYRLQCTGGTYLARHRLR